MSDRNRGSHYENHHQAAELHDLATHTHGAAEHSGKQDHLTGHEQSRQALEHSNQAHQQSLQPHQRYGGNGHEHKESQIAARAYQLWLDRGCPEGSPEEDWRRAVKELESSE
jgi:hypothetical protein